MSFAAHFQLGVLFRPALSPRPAARRQNLGGGSDHGPDVAFDDCGQPGGRAADTSLRPAQHDHPRRVDHHDIGEREYGSNRFVLGGGAVLPADHRISRDDLAGAAGLRPPRRAERTSGDGDQFRRHDGFDGRGWWPAWAWSPRRISSRSSCRVWSGVHRWRRCERARVAAGVDGASARR